MSSWKKQVTKIAADAEAHFDALKLKIGERLALHHPLIIQPYLGYGTTEKLFLRGRVLQDKGEQLSADNDTVWQNILNTYRRLESDEVPGAEVALQLESQEITAVTDEEGYFQFEFAPDLVAGSTTLWYPLQLTLTDAPFPIETAVTAKSQALIPPASARFGVISDIDDTILKSSATAVLQAARLLFLNNARTRLPFAGVSAFYHALQQGSQPPENNPIFYVSSSPWNLFQLLTDFIQFHNIPLGPLFLKDYGISANQFLTSGHLSHKMAQIDQIMTTYPHLNFILIGDSGQKDPEIYREVVWKYPGRVLAVYIRDVSQDRRDRDVLAIAGELHQMGIPLLLIPDSLTAVEHAVSAGFIQKTAVAACRAEIEADTAMLE